MRMRARYVRVSSRPQGNARKVLSSTAISGKAPAHRSRPAGTSPGKTDPAERFRRRLLLATACLLVLINGIGCSRQFWRRNADKNTYHILGQKTTDPRWSTPRLDLQADPRSRFFDPYDPDCPPLPPDDPAAHEYMHCVYGMRGYKAWHDFGDAISIENPHWLEPYGLAPWQLGEQGPPAIEGLTLAQAVELSYIHSREYQTQLENLYLTALALTFERFRFNVRYLGFGGEPSTDLTYENVPGVEDSLSMSNRFGISRLLPTGGQWIVEMANNTLWLFSGGNQSSTASVLSYSLVQPLLLGAGRKIALEGLTQAERNVLYAARDFARFRQEFFVSTVSGGGANAGAYFGLLRQRQAILNQQNNIAELVDQVERLRALSAERPDEISAPLPQLPEGVAFPQELAPQVRFDADDQRLFWRGSMTEEQFRALLALSDEPAYQTAVRDLYQRSESETVTLDVTQLETRLANSQGGLLQAERAFQDSFDRYKLQLGLPPDMKITLDVSLLRPFQLIDPRIAAIQRAFTDFVTLTAQLPDENPSLPALRNVVRELRILREQLNRNGVEVIEEDFRRLAANWDKRMESLTDPQQRSQTVANVERDRQLFEYESGKLAEADAVLAEIQAAVSQEQVPLRVRDGAVPMIRELREEYLRIARSLSVIQIGLRTELITLNEFDLPIDDAVRIGLENRVDLMNARALVMDARRKMEVAANALQAALDIRVEGDIATRSVGAGNNNPLDFRGAESSFRAGVSFTAPLDQVLERNAYRAALINYQRERRNYMAFEDEVKISIRQAWRQLTALRQSFEISRQAVRLAALQLDQASEQAVAPLQAGQTRARGSQGLNLLNALNAVLQAQNGLIEDWVNYETNRLNIHRDMGIMQIDERGLWYDDYYQNALPANPPASEVHPPAAFPASPQALRTPEPADASNESSPPVIPNAPPTRPDLNDPLGRASVRWIRGRGTGRGERQGAHVSQSTHQLSDRGRAPWAAGNQDHRARQSG